MPSIYGTAWVPQECRPRATNSGETIVEAINNQEVIMEIAIVMGLLVSVFAVGAAAILWTPYDR